MEITEIPDRGSWKQDLAPYLAVDARRSLGQIASVVLPYFAVWIAAALIEPSAPVAIALGLVATVFLTRMYSLFHDLTHNSLFESRRANSSWGSSCSRPTAGGSASTPSTTRTPATSSTVASARSTR
jgi:fatty acid desaturase